MNKSHQNEGGGGGQDYRNRCGGEKKIFEKPKKNIEKEYRKRFD